MLILWLLLVKRPPKSPSKQIKNYSSKLLRLGEISVDPTISILGIVNIRIGALWKFRHSDNESLGNQRKEIDKFLEKLPRRLVIVIDDIDRLDGEETRLIFKLVKLVADFPNTIFLLAYDREKVGKRMDEWSIRDGDSIEGQEYLKKIVQQPFPLPKPEKDDIYTELLKAIGNELNRIGFDRKQVSDLHWFNLVSFNEPLMELFSTIRDVKRYVNSLRLDLSILDKEEINPIDFACIEAIRVFAPEVYLAMTNEARVFTSVGVPRYGPIEGPEDVPDEKENWSGRNTDRHALMRS